MSNLDMVEAKVLVWGWQPQPNARGTLDIIYSCLCTIFLCSWSCVCLNVAKSGTTRWGVYSQRLQWQIFTVVFPELSLSLAAEQ